MANSARFADGMRRVINGASSSSVAEDFPPLGKTSSDPKATTEIPSSAPPTQPVRVNPNGEAVESARGDGVSSCWSSLFADTAVKLSFVAPCTKDGKKLVNIPKTILDQGISLWNDCLLGQFFGLPPKLQVMQSHVDKLWGRNGRVEVIPLVGEGLLFKFGDPATLSWVLERGPWFIACMPLLLQKWKTGLVLEKLTLDKFPLWVVLRGIPLELFTPEGLSCIASAIGTPLCLDKATE